MLEGGEKSYEMCKIRVSAMQCTMGAPNDSLRRLSTGVTGSGLYRHTEDCSDR